MNASVATAQRPPADPQVSGRSFVGRERDLEMLLQGLSALDAGRGSLFLLSVEAGIGKTRLADLQP